MGCVTVSGVLLATDLATTLRGARLDRSTESTCFRALARSVRVAVAAAELARAPQPREPISYHYLVGALFVDVVLVHRPSRLRIQNVDRSVYGLYADDTDFLSFEF